MYICRHTTTSRSVIIVDVPDDGRAGGALHLPELDEEAEGAGDGDEEGGAGVN